MARREGLAEVLMSIGAKIPWKVALAAAVVSFIALRVVAIKTEAPVTTSNLADFGAVAQHGFIHVFAAILQYVVPACLLIGTTVGFFKRRQSSALYGAAQANPTVAIASMSWREFEKLVGEAFRQRGFKVSGFGGQGPDGGVDLGLTKNGQRFLVQCKHWRTRQVGVTVVRELNGVLSSQGAHGGFVVTGGEFTREAREFAKSCPIELIDGEALQELIGAVQAKASDPTSEKAAVQSDPVCPRCGGAMVKREAKQGKFAGQLFWGCRGYPKCAGILRI